MTTSTETYTAPTGAPPAPFVVTDAAAARIARITSDEPAGTKFRIQVQGGGCSGFQYRFDLDPKQAAEGEIILEKNGSAVIIDDMSFGFLAGSTLDYEEELGSAGFAIKNPNATAKCGCGNSFSV